MKTYNNIINTLKSLAILSVLSSCSATPAKENNEASLNINPAVETYLLKKDKFSTRLQLPGELIAFQQVDMYSKVTGFVKTLKVDIGSQVKTGQLLISLEAPELLTQMLVAESKLKSQEAIYMSSKANYNRLLETSKTPGTVSNNDLDIAESKMNSDLSNLEAAKAFYKEMSVMQNYLEIRAPFDGIVTARNINLGAYVGPSGKGSEFPLLTIQDQKKLRLAVSIPESYTSYLHLEDSVDFKVSSLPGDSFSARIKRMSGALDLRLRSERVEMDVNNLSKNLLPGMVAEVGFSLSAVDSSFVIPKSALVSSNEGVYVIKVIDGKTKITKVKKGRETNGKIEIFGDLAINKEILLKANEEIKDGVLIK